MLQVIEYLALIGLTVFLATNGEWGIAVGMVFCMIPGPGFLLRIAMLILLAIRAPDFGWIPFIVLAGTIVFNLVIYPMVLIFAGKSRKQ